MAKCVLCGNDVSIEEKDSLIINHVPEFTFEFSEKTISLYLINCNFCGAVQLFNVPLSEHYTDVHRSIGISKDYRNEKKEQLQKFIVKYNLQESSMIEVGCGDGQILEMFKELGYNVYGVETGEENIAICESKGLNVLYGSIQNISKQYDAFFSFYHLEHFPNPIKFVMDLYRILKPEGIGLIEVPNYDYIEKKNLWLEFTKDHRIYYRKKTLEYLLLNFGFSIKSIEENTNGLCLTITVCKQKKNDGFIGMKAQIKSDEVEFKKLIESLNDNFAIFGAGHYSQLLINMVNEKYGITPKYIFDSNKQKCGNKLCGVLIEHKSNIDYMRDCKNIIVICGLYNNEVVEMLEELNKNKQWENIIAWN